MNFFDHADVDHVLTKRQDVLVLVLTASVVKLEVGDLERPSSFRQFLYTTPRNKKNNKLFISVENLYLCEGLKHHYYGVGAVMREAARVVVHVLPLYLTQVT